jgi:hypothetical protein
VIWPHWQQSTGEVEQAANKFFEFKKKIVLYSTYFTVLSKMEGNSTHNCDSFKVHNFC